ncbi:uncharacterized protein CBL_06356 [Carabus blaptoides fortunei]
MVLILFPANIVKSLLPRKELYNDTYLYILEKHLISAIYVNCPNDLIGVKCVELDSTEDLN